MKKTLSVALVMLAVCTFGSAHAALQNNGGGLVYDSELNITWYFDSTLDNFAVWDDALAWAAGLNVGGVSGWRLPTTPGTTIGYTTEGELGHLFSALGGVPGSQLLNYSPFETDIRMTFWTDIAYEPPDLRYAVDYSLPWGFQGLGQRHPYGNQFIWGIAVHAGNVTPVSPPPFPGTWYFQVFGDSPSTNSPYWASGTMILDSTGAVTGGTVINDSGVTKTLTGGSFTIDSVGQAAGTLTLSDGAIESFPHGKLDAGKTVLTMVNSDTNYRGLFVAAKGEGTFTQADLAGTWYLQTFGDSPSTNAPYWAYGTIILDSTGAVIGGTATNNYGVTKTTTGGSFTIDSAGQVAGTLTLSDGTTESFPHGKLDAGKTVLTMVTSDLNYIGLLVAAKGGVTGACSGDFASDGDVDGSDLAALIANASLLDITTFTQNFGRNSCQ
jgi:hypothetical protein